MTLLSNLERIIDELENTIKQKDNIIQSLQQQLNNQKDKSS